VLDLAGYHTTQTASENDARSSTERLRSARTILLQEHMTPISRVARADLPQTPEMLSLRMPRGRPSTERLASHAYGMGRTATRFAEKFVASGLPADFVSRLNAAADAMLAAADERVGQRTDRTGATKALKAKLARARRIVAVLDPLVKTAAKGDQFLLAKWDGVKRVSLVGTASSQSADPSAPQAPPVVS
jgi:hypothetical protein